MRDARQAEPKMSRLKVFYIIISIGALFSKVRIRNPGMTSWAMLMMLLSGVGHVLVFCTSLPSLPRP